MAILNAFAGSGGGVRIPLEAPTTFSLAPQDGKFLLTWTDPVDKVATPGGEAVATWNYTIVIRKVGSVPQTPTDGIEILREHTRNQYQSTAYVDDLYIENGITYYYAVFAVSTIGVLSEPATANGEPMPASPEFLKNETISPANKDYSSVSATQNHVVIVGGDNGSGISTDRSTVVTTFDVNLTKGTLSPYNSVYATPGQFNGHAIFMGGASAKYGNGSDNGVRAYTPSLTTRNLSMRNPHSGDNVIGLGCSETHVLFAGGEDASTIVDGYNTAFTRVSPAALSQGLSGLSGCSVGEYIIFAGGGYDYSSNKDAIAYSSSLTKIDNLAGLYQHTTEDGGSGRYTATATTGTYALFAGNNVNNSENTQITAYNASLTRQPSMTLSGGVPNGSIKGFVSISGYAMFAFRDYGESAVANCFDNSLTRRTEIGTIPDSSSYSDLAMGGGSIGQYAMFYTCNEKVHIYQCV